MAKFTVDTHLFRELGDLLVGRDSTALVQLIKNACDADATSVLVYGEALEDRERGVIRVSDDGVGMSMLDFEHGFLRIASRSKEQGSRVSKRFKRRYTGAKGIGRLAAHKLARVIEIESVASEPNSGSTVHQAVAAKIDWDLIEKQETLDDLGGTDTILVDGRSITGDMKSGTTITLRRLRRRWSPEERGRFLAEVQSSEPPSVLVSWLPDGVVNIPPLL